MARMKQPQRHSHPLPGTKPTNRRLPERLVEALENLRAARSIADEEPMTKSAQYHEAIEWYIQSVDPATGRIRPKPADSPVQMVERPLIVLHPGLPLFSDYIEFNDFQRDEAMVAAMDASNMMIWMAGPDNECLHVSPLLASYTGFAASGFLAFGWAAAICPEDRQVTMDACMAGFQTRRSFVFNYRLRRYDGTFAWVQDHACPRHRPDGSYAGYVGTIYQTCGVGGIVHFIPRRAGLATPTRALMLAEPASNGK